MQRDRSALRAEENWPAGRDRVAVLYQASKPPVRDGAAKPVKPGGYSDSGADIASALQSTGIAIAAPVASPDPARHSDWVFPDSEGGIEAALDAGATVLWANTSLFAGHPLERVKGAARVVGQVPAEMEEFDDKFATNRLLRSKGIPVPASVLVLRERGAGARAIGDLSESLLAASGLSLPLMLKPVRGRGSQGVVRVETFGSLRDAAEGLMSARETVNGASYPLYGSRMMLEQYLPGEEITLTVMPRGNYRLPDGCRRFEAPWSLPAVRRTGHNDGVVPYNGVVPVAHNSVALSAAEHRDPALEEAIGACERAAEVLGIRAPIRIDCRRESADPDARFLLFDLNMKPNLTGAGRPGRETQDCLSALAARALGWSYPDLLLNMLAQAW